MLLIGIWLFLPYVSVRVFSSPESTEISAQRAEIVIGFGWHISHCAVRMCQNVLGANFKLFYRVLNVPGAGVYKPVCTQSSQVVACSAGCRCVVLLAFVGGLTLLACACALDDFLLYFLIVSTGLPLRYFSTQWRLCWSLSCQCSALCLNCGGAVAAVAGALLGGDPGCVLLVAVPPGVSEPEVYFSCARRGASFVWYHSPPRA